MKFQVSLSVVEIMQGNLVNQDVEVIVNAANSSLLGGGGVDAAVHQAAGPELLEECRKIGGCPTGEARITMGYGLRADRIIHAVGPRYRRVPEDAVLLARAYRSALQLAERHWLPRIAFPAISTGAYAYPVNEAAAIALLEVRTHLETRTRIKLVRFVLWDTRTERAFEQAAIPLLGQPLRD